MDEKILTGHPVDAAEKFLIDAFRQDFIKQADRFDDLSKELFKVELAVPSVYVVALRLTIDQQHPLSAKLVIAAFVLWFFALSLTLATLFPQRWEVQENVASSIRVYFLNITRYKRFLLCVSVFIFFIGLFAAALAMLI